ncbi:MAG: DsrE family protein [Candidatus Rokubacteria bacterium]|nr:DsrE family protein [Candidatus Rokubacteria bacterium]
MVVLRRPPLSSEAATEALRVAVGQTLAPQRVTLCLIDDGVWTVGPLNPSVVRAPEIKKHLDALLTLGHRVVVEKEAAEARGLDDLASGIELTPRTECFAWLTEADAVIAY